MNTSNRKGAVFFMRKMRIRILLLVFDVLIGVSLVLGVWGYNYLIPRAETTGEYSVDGEAIQNPWQQTYAEHFTDHLVSTDTSYTSPNLSITITRDSFDTGKLDTTESGKHIKYGTKTA